MFLDKVVFGLFSIVAFFLQKRIKEGVDPPEGSERDTAFKKNRGFMRDVVKAVIAQRKEGGGDEHIPFIDNLLQSGVPDDQARRDDQDTHVPTCQMCVCLRWPLPGH